MVAKKTERENVQCDLACIEREQYSVHARNLYTGYVLSGSRLSLLLTGVPKHHQTLTIMILSVMEPPGNLNFQLCNFVVFGLFNSENM